MLIYSPFKISLLRRTTRGGVSCSTRAPLPQTRTAALDGAMRRGIDPQGAVTYESNKNGGAVRVPDESQLQMKPTLNSAPSIPPRPIQSHFIVHILLLSLLCFLGSAGSAMATPTSPLDLTSTGHGLLSYMLHLDKHMAALIQSYGSAIYGILFAIVFCETGLVLTPFLPGDSLLFAAGAFAGMGQLNLLCLFFVFLTSAILGDAVNYLIGSKLGRWAIDKGLVAEAYVKKTELFYAKYGGKTVVLARFVPIIRTFAPFVAGVGSMPYGSFAFYNVAGAVIWTTLFVGAGYLFGGLPFVQKNFTLVVLGIVAVSVVPVVIEVIQARKEGYKDN